MSIYIWRQIEYALRSTDRIIFTIDKRNIGRRHTHANNKTHAFVRIIGRGEILQITNNSDYASAC